MAGLCAHKYLSPTYDSYFSWNRGKLCNRMGNKIWSLSDRRPLLDYTRIFTNHCFPRRGGYVKWPRKPEDCVNDFHLYAPPLMQSAGDEASSSCPNLRIPPCEFQDCKDTFRRCMHMFPNLSLPNSEYSNAYCERFWRDRRCSCRGRGDEPGTCLADPSRPGADTTLYACCAYCGDADLKPDYCMHRFAAAGIRNELDHDKKYSRGPTSTFSRCVITDPDASFPDSEYTTRYASPTRNPGCNVYGVAEDVYRQCPDTLTRHVGTSEVPSKPCPVYYEPGLEGHRCCGEPAYKNAELPLEDLVLYDRKDNELKNPLILDHAEGYLGYVPKGFRKQETLFGGRMLDTRGYQLGNAVEHTHGTTYYGLNCPHSMTKNCTGYPKCSRVRCSHCLGHNNYR